MTQVNRNSETKRTERPKRVPVSGYRDVLTVEGKDPAFVYRWVNDDPGRIDRFKQGGYELVDHDVNVGQRKLGSSDSVDSVVTKSVGGNSKAMLMRIKREWYEEDQAAKAQQVNGSEEAMRQTINQSKADGFSKAKIEIS